MITKTLYRVKRSDGGIDITPNEPLNTECTETYRLIADEGMVLTDGANTYCCVDTDEPDKYSEIPEPSETVDPYSEAGKILLGVSE